MIRELNPEIRKKCIQLNLYYDFYASLLLGYYYGLKPVEHDSQLTSNLSLAGFYQNGKLIIDVFKEEIVTGITKDLVKNKYCKLFSDVNSTRKGFYLESERRIRKFLKENPLYSFDDIIKATKEYLRQTDPKYIQYPHYFIKKGKGVESISNLANWLELMKEQQEVKAISKSNTMS